MVQPILFCSRARADRLQPTQPILRIRVVAIDAELVAGERNVPPLGPLGGKLNLARNVLRVPVVQSVLRQLPARESSVCFAIAAATNSDVPGNGTCRNDWPNKPRPMTRLGA